MNTTLMKYLMIAVTAPALALSQEPPTPPTPVSPAPRVRPAPAAKPVEPVDVRIKPKFEYDYEYKIDHKIEAKLDEMKFHLDNLKSHDMQMALETAAKVRVDFEPQMKIALQAAQTEMLRNDRELQRATLEAERAMQRSQLEIDRNLERAKIDMERALNRSGLTGQDRFEYAKPRSGWAQEDPADSLYRVARESLNRGEYRRAAQGFNELIKKYPRSQYALDSQYWEAFARYRAGTTDDLRAALKLLEDPRMAGIRSNESSMDVSGLRTRVQGALASRGDADAARALRAEASTQQSATCDREDVSVRGEALNALGQMDITTAMPVVKKVLARRDECTVELRRRALYLLGRTPNAESVPLMLDVAKNDTDPEIRSEAMRWLSRTAGDQAVPMLEELLKTSTEERTQRSAVSALGSIDTDKARKAVRVIIERNDVNERVRMEAISSLSRDRDNRTMMAEDMAYLRGLYGKVETQRLKESVLSAVSRFEAAENEAWLLGIAKNENESPSLRSQALSRLGRMTTVSFTEIGKLYENADSRALRQQILRGLSERKEPEAVDKLVEVAKKDTDPNIRTYAIQLLARSNNPKALQVIKELADRP